MRLLAHTSTRRGALQDLYTNALKTVMSNQYDKKRVVRHLGSAAIVAILGFATPALGAPSTGDLTSISAARGIRVQIHASLPYGKGRLILFARPQVGAELPQAIDGNAFNREHLHLASRDVSLTSGQSVVLDGDDNGFPTSLADLPSGIYAIQAVLDRDYNYAYAGRGPGDVITEVSHVEVLDDKISTVTLTLQQVVPPLLPWHGPWGPTANPKDLETIQAQTDRLALPSAHLARFWGRKIEMRALVVRPLGYDRSTDQLPVVYLTHGFGGGLTSLEDTAAGLIRQMKAGDMPGMLWVLLDQSGPMGTHEFADSLNNGPWGTALTKELIPFIDGKYRTDARRGARFVTGHSSGGWAALWLQLEYPELFGGAWSTSPDYSDFTNFGGVDLTQPNARMPDVEFARAESVLGALGGQASSFEAVWSPRASDGSPAQLYDRETGLVDSEVAAWWIENWDLVQKVRREWQQRAGLLNGTLSVIVGENDEFALDESARDLQHAIEEVSGKASFRYLPGKGHFDLYVEGTDRAALRRVIAWEMFAKARNDR